MKTVLFIVGIVAAAVIISWSLGWINVGGRAVSAQNVREQFRDGYTNHESLAAIAANYCSAVTAMEATTEPTERTQRVTQVAAQEQNYHRVAANYNAAMADAFRGRLVKPNDLPDRAETFKQAAAAAGC